MGRYLWMLRRQGPHIEALHHRQAVNSGRPQRRRELRQPASWQLELAVLRCRYLITDAPRLGVLHLHSTTGEAA